MPERLAARELLVQARPIQRGQPSRSASQPLERERKAALKAQEQLRAHPIVQHFVARRPHHRAIQDRHPVRELDLVRARVQSHPVTEFSAISLIEEAWGPAVIPVLPVTRPSLSRWQARRASIQDQDDPRPPLERSPDAHPLDHQVSRQPSS